MSLTKLSQDGKNLIIPAQGEFGDILAGDGKIVNLFLQCTGDKYMVLCVAAAVAAAAVAAAAVAAAAAAAAEPPSCEGRTNGRGRLRRSS